MYMYVFRENKALAGIQNTFHTCIGMKCLLFPLTNTSQLFRSSIRFTKKVYTFEYIIERYTQDNYKTRSVVISHAFHRTVRKLTVTLSTLTLLYVYLYYALTKTQKKKL